MAVVLDIDGLSYMNFHDFNLSFDNKVYYSVIGSNKCGKTTLFKLISGIIPSSNTFCCDSIILNSINAREYITKIGVVNRVNGNSFIFNSVLDEMLYPLKNLGYSREKSLIRIKKVLGLFNVTNFQDKLINELDYYDQQLLLIMIAILHKPKVLLLDSVLDIFSNEAYQKIVNVLRNIDDELTIINFTNSLEIAYNSDRIILLDNYKMIGEYKPVDIYNNDKLFYEHNLEIPFIVDLSIKLKMYNLIDKEFFNMKEMVDDIWP